MHHDKGINFIKGALLGGLAAGITGILLAPKSGRELRDDIVNGYNTVTEKTQDFKDEVINRGRHLFGMEEEEEEHSHSSMLIGLIVGGAITTIVTLLLAPESGKKLRARLGHHYDDIRSKAEDFVNDVGEKGHDTVEYLSDWKDTLLTLVNKLSSHNARRGRSENAMDQIVDWASFGLGVLQQLQKRR